MAFWDRFKKIDTSPQSGKAQPEKPDPCEDQTFAPRFKEKKINVFVSSTFKDMKAERDELTLRVFPSLRKECEERGIAWGEVDLRWGIPEEKSKKEALGICLDYIERCRPYFIGMLGERYGWIDPDAAEKVKDDHPWVKEQAGKSITELEILHGVLNNPAMAGHAYFYFRDKAYLESKTFEDTVKEEERADFFETDEESVRKLTDLKQRIRDAGSRVRENYPDPVQFGELVKGDLMRVIDSLAPAPKPLTEAERATARLDREERAHEAFAASRFGVYIPRQEYFDRLDTHARGDGPPLVVLGESGGGKSALLAHWAFRYRNRHPDDPVLVHFVGASSESPDWASMLRRFMGEFKRKFYLTEEIPAKEEDLMAAFRNWLSMAAVHGRVVLVIDALNQLEDRNGAPDLVWLPPTIPANIRLVLSTLPGRSLDATRKRGWPEMTVEPLTVSEREDLITCYLRKYRRELDAPLHKELARTEQTKNPLFLRALLEELRVHGEFGKLSDLVKDYLAAQTVDELYEKILVRYESDYDRDRRFLVKDAVSLIWAARRGLSKPELMDLLGTGGERLPDAYWAPLYLAMEHSLLEKDRRITFFHDYFRKAVEHRYLPDVESKRMEHLKIADYFTQQTDSLRRIEELPWQLAEAKEWDRLVVLLAVPIFFSSAWEAQEYEVRRYWVEIETESSHEMIEIYRSAILNPTQFPCVFIWSLRDLFYHTSHLSEASILGTHLIQFFKESGKLDWLAAALGNQALILKSCGDFDGAMVLLKEAYQIQKERGDLKGQTASLGNQANILYSKGDLENAMALYQEMEMLCREQGDNHYLALCLGNKAAILYSKGDLENAMALYKEMERLCREQGNIDGLADGLNNQAAILATQNNLKDAMALYKETERIFRQFGNIDGLASCLGGQANILKSWYDLPGAMTLYVEQERIYRELKKLDKLADNLGNQGSILYSRGDLNGAMASYKEMEGIDRELMNFNGVGISIGAQALIHYSKGDLDGAMALHQKEEQIWRELENNKGLAACFGNQSNIFSDRGNLKTAMEFLKKQEQINRELEDNDELATCLGNQALILHDQGDLDGAMALLNEVEKIDKNLNKIDRLAVTLGNKATLLVDQGDLDGAMALLKEEERINRNLANVKGLSHSLSNQARILLHQKYYKEAQAAAYEAYYLASSHGYTALAMQIQPILERVKKGN